jgi:hypothetical protein
MENGPTADFHMSFYNEIKVFTCMAKKTLEIIIPRSLEHQFRSYLVKKSSSRYIVDISDAVNVAVEPEFTMIFNHAQECLRQCLDIENSSRFDQCTKYPLVLKSSKVSKNLAFSESNTKISVHPGSMSNYSTSRSVNQDLQQRQAHTSLQNSASHASHDQMSASNSPDFLPIFLDNVGWCIPMPDRQFLMLFCDGLSVNVNSKTQSISSNPQNDNAQM